MRRHLHSVVLASFFRWARDVHDVRYKNVGQFFTPSDRPSGTELLSKYLDSRPKDLEDALHRIVPEDALLRGSLVLQIGDGLTG